MRFIRYPLGGHIAPHTDGRRVDASTGRTSTTSFLLYLTTIPEGEGGETLILDRLPESCAEGEAPRVVREVSPREGSILLFPQETTPHMGSAVGGYPKVLLRGDLY